MQNELRQTCRRLLDEGEVQVVIGYGQSDGGATYPVFITRADDADQLVWNDRCFANLTAYLSNKDIRALGKIAICVKGCDARALVALEKESQIDRAQLVVIGLVCDGVGQPRRAKCETCDVHTPAAVDITIGEQTASSTAAIVPEQRYADVDAFLQKTPEERLAYWTAELSRCTKCYACRQVCPMCYCRQCIVDKNRPVVISTSATLKGTFAWQITRAFHLAGRCIGCDECSRVCPAKIDLRLLNLSLAKIAEERFSFRAGMSGDAEPLIGSYSEQDREEFIR